MAVGWWSDDGDAYVIRHHAGYQRTREQVLAQQAANAANGRRGGRPRKGSGTPREISEVPPSKTQLVNESVSESKSERDGTGSGRTGSYETEINNGDGERDDGWPDLAPIPGSGDGLTSQQRAVEAARARQAERRRQAAAR
jgi:hypothetical protein